MADRTTRTSAARLSLRPRRFDYDTKMPTVSNVILVLERYPVTKEKRASLMAAVILCVAHAGASSVSAQEEPRPLVAHEAVRALVGHTLVYTKPGPSGEETGVFIRLDGTGLSATHGPDGLGRPRLIQWSNLSDGEFCVTEVGRKPWDGDCGRLSTVGTRATLTSKSGVVWPARVLEGDAWQLDPTTISEKRLVGSAAIHAIVGNTIVILSAGEKRETSAHYYMADGKMRRAHNEDPYFDNWDLQPEEKWSVRGEADQLCFSEGGWKKDLCLGISVTGDRVTFEGKRIGLIHGILLKGDARNLSPAAEKANSAKASALVGNTLLLKAADRQADTDSAIYFLRDGIGRAKRGRAAAVPIKWMIQLNGNLCIIEARREFRDNSCTSLSIDGSAATLAAPGRAEIRGQILTGNALKI